VAAVSSVLHPQWAKDQLGFRLFIKYYRNSRLL
jgi:hypothetical protein